MFSTICSVLVFVCWLVFLLLEERGRGSREGFGFESVRGRLHGEFHPRRNV